MKSVKPDEFFKLVAINSGVTDLETVRRIFYGIIKTITKELVAKHTIKLPDWGEFILRIYKSRRIFDVTDRSHRVIPAKPTVKFVADYKMKKYFRMLGSDSTVVK